MTSIETSSRHAVAELHRLLGLLRRPDDIDDVVAAQPGLAQLGDLVEEAKQGQLSVDLSIEGSLRVLPPTLDISAYRVIQEALTNTRKHSGATTAVVRVHYGAATLDVDIVDDGNGHPEIAPRAVATVSSACANGQVSTAAKCQRVHDRRADSKCTQPFR